MKLREAVATGDIQDLADQYANAFEDGDQGEMQNVEGLMAAQLAGKGWDKAATKRFLDELAAAGDGSDVYKLMTKYNLFDRKYTLDEYSPTDETNMYKVQISIPLIEKDAAKADSKELVSFLKEKGIKVIKAKSKSTSPFKVADNTVMDVDLDMIIKTKMERDEIFNVIEPRYELVSCEEIINGKIRDGGM